MSRIGKKPIAIPAGVQIEISGSLVKVKGAKGELARDFGAQVSIAREEELLKVSPVNQTKAARSMWGTARMHLANMIEGVSVGFSKQLQIEGIGYRAATEGNNLILNMGFSHPVAIAVPEGAVSKVEKNIITISGCDKELVGKVAAQVRRVRPPEPYKGKGIRYVGEKVRRKAGKKAGGTAK
jgi:ribosomal protein L6, bacterial type